MTYSEDYKKLLEKVDKVVNEKKLSGNPRTPVDFSYSNCERIQTKIKIKIIYKKSL